MTEIAIIEMPEQLRDRYGKTFNLEVNNLHLISSNESINTTGMIYFNVVDLNSKSLFLDWLNPSEVGFGLNSKFKFNYKNQSLEITFQATKFNFNTGSLEGIYYLLNEADF